jgi:hypothetical protein
MESLKLAKAFCFRCFPFHGFLVAHRLHQPEYGRTLSKSERVEKKIRGALQPSKAYKFI